MGDNYNSKLKFEICEYGLKLTNLINSLNQNTQNKVDINQIEKAVYYARKYHASQTRKSGEPYYSHPVEVACLFAEYTAKENIKYYTTNLVITAILHDAIEDTNFSKEMIEEVFNKEIAQKVEDLTRIKFDKKITSGENLNVLFTDHKKDVLYIKLFDRLHNIRTIKFMKQEKISKILEESFYYFLPLSVYLEVKEVKDEIVKTYHNQMTSN